MRIADLHCHYPMHTLSGDKPRLRDAIRAPSLGDKGRSTVMWIANRVANYRTFWSGPRVTAEKLRAGEVGLTLSVLISPLSELDLDEPYGAPPEPEYPSVILDQLDAVEADLSGREGVRIVRSAADLDAALEAGHVAIVHAVEGGFHLGPTPSAIDATVAELARRGVGYITLAHLFYRGVATNAPAIPFLPDGTYDKLFPQDEDGLSDLGVAAVRAMVREHVLVDVCHMRADALAETFALLDGLDPGRRVGVLASHAGVRLGSEAYMLAPDTVERIAERDGVVGIILAQSHLNDGVRKTNTRTFKASFDVICRHVDRLREITGGHDHTAFGTDLDGFVKPVLGGLDDASNLKQLGPALAERYGAGVAERITHGNAERVVRRALAARA